MNIYALLIAIDNYPITHHRLNGCVNDRNAFQAYLENRAKKQENLNLHLKMLTDEEATRNGIIAGFTHFDAAKDGDLCLTYYSGHGSQAPAPEEFWHLEPDRMLESIVCYDSRLPGGNDLMDKELSYLFWKATKDKNVKMVAIFDCCHSGQNFKDIQNDYIKARMAEPSRAVLELEKFVWGSAVQVRNNEINVPRSDKIIHLAAAKSSETAKELSINGNSRGVFTYSMLEVLEQSSSHLTYGELINLVGVRIANKVKEQTPQLETSQAIDKRSLFLDGVIDPHPAHYYVSYKKGKWILDAGAIQGIQLSQGKEKTVLALEEDGEEIEVIDVAPNYAEVAGMEGRDTERQFKVAVKKMPAPRLKVAFASPIDKAGRTAVENVWKEFGEPALDLVEVQHADYLIKAEKGSLRLTLPGDDRPVFRRVEGYTDEKAKVFLTDVQTVARWKKVLDLSNPATTIQTKDFQIELFQTIHAGDFDNSAEVKPLDWTDPETFRYDFVDGEWKNPAFQLKITNTSDRNLTVSALYLQADFKVTNQFLAKQELAPQEYVWMVDLFNNEPYRTIPLEVDDKFHAWGITRVTEHIKVIVSTDDKLNTDGFNQEGLELDVPEGFVAKRAGRREQNRPDKPDWTAVTIPITIIRPMEEQPIWAMQPVDSLNAISLKAPSGLSGKASLSNEKDAKEAIGKTESATRSLDKKSAKDALSQFPDWEDYLFTEPTQRAPGLSVLELRDVEGAENITAETPLKIQLHQPLAEHEIVLPIGYDEETGLYYPVGISEGTRTIKVDTLPPPSASGTRSLGGSIKIFFKKVVLQPLFGAEYEYPVLAQAVFTDGDNFRYETDLETIKTAVANADRIVLFIHGIIGDTTEMPKSLKWARQNDVPAETLYDVALTFDYENLKTRLDQTARDLKKRLEAIGLGEGHGKTLHIVAHSMGGLISRWMIEKEGGNKIVSHLIQLGTPNAGSAWSSAYELTTTLLSRALQLSSVLQPWLIPLTLAGRAADQLFTNLQQMHKDSDFLKKLNDATDPGIPYSIIAGNTSLLHDHSEKEFQNLVQKMLRRFQKGGVYQALDTLIFHRPNDIAVSVESIFGIPGIEGRELQTTQQTVPCDHISYFHDQKGLVELGNVLFSLLTP